MIGIIKSFWNDENGLGTVEIVVILAILVSIALIFRNQIISFVRDTLAQLLGDTDASVISE